MKLNKYEIFVKVVEMGSLTKAGEMLNLTQSAVSHAISGLEQDIGLTLLIRNRSGIQLTSIGERLIHYFKEIKQINDRLYQEVSLIKGLEIGTVKIGVFTSISIHWLPAILKQFNVAFPFIEVKLLDGNYQEIENWIATGAIDFGFVNLPTHNALEKVSLKQDRMLCILPPDHVLRGQSTIRLEHIIDEPFIMPISGCDTDVRRILSENKLSPKVKYELEDDHAIMSMVQNGLGVSILPEMILSGTPYNLCVRPLEGGYFRTIGIASVSFKNASPATKKMVQFITAWVDRLT
ncbi:LysR family transcriptional regulator [Paenibacillus alkalitolerans]|uniref:LysR family transcriptional regulator n=1 Tax=Paenibacillus alkalitolerans TaxID=2799335 RepID=UPI0018F47167|nr:LysR family transcriptional regulator [Paenibacillus alkalitolerans]